MPEHDAREDLEQTVDRLEERVLGHTVDQTRDDEEEHVLLEQDQDRDTPSSGPASEPTE